MSGGIQGLVDDINKAAQMERSKYHVTVGKLIDRLETLPGHWAVRFSTGDGSPWATHSYRGDYCDMGISAQRKLVTVSMLLAQFKALLGTKIHGYKGGTYTVDRNTPLWRSNDSGHYSQEAIVGIEALEKYDVVHLEVRHVA